MNGERSPSDCEHIEQMAIVLKLFDEKENKPIETFILSLHIQHTENLFLNVIQ